MQIPKVLHNVVANVDTFREAARARNPKLLRSLLGPAVRGFILQEGKQGGSTSMPVGGQALFDWQYERNQAELARLYAVAKESQWNGATDLPWETDVDPFDESRDLFPEEYVPLTELRQYRNMSQREQLEQRYGIIAWMLSQFLHGEQGALFAACQVTEAVGWMDGKLYGSTQVVDEGRHVEVFHQYLTTKLCKLYQVNDNLYTIIAALMTDSRWDIKFLGMQIMIEGVALGAFGTIRGATREPLLRELLKYVITDEARHVHYGVVALRDFYTTQISEKERQEREDWAFEISLLLRNRFLAHEFYDEYWGHVISRRTWDRIILGSRFMRYFRDTMFRRIVPNLKRIGLLTDRIRPHYEAIGLLQWETGKAAPDLTANDLLETVPPPA